MSKKELHRRVGDFISPVHTNIKVNQTVEEAIAYIRQHPTREKIFYFYVIDSDMHLKGVVSTRRLLLSPLDKKIHEILEEHVISISANHTLREAMEILTSHRLLAVPVVDEENRLLGIIDVQLYLEEAVDVAKTRHSTTDLFQVLGLKLEEGKVASTWLTYRTRMPWIFCNMIGGIGCAIISRIFEGVLIQVILLAMFIPLVLSLSESISMQSMTYSLQILSRPKISRRRILYRILSEWRMVFFLGLTCGIIVGGLSLLWGDGIHPAIAIASGIILSVTITGTVAAAIPLILHARKLDPKVAAGPVVLMFADVITTIIYLGLSSWWLLL
ncbi:MAG: Magnesium transporter MgtE [Chlamydiae bacterium]|nr:Magnesium transporter MgtE [Chlamydiota bacterium]